MIYFGVFFAAMLLSSLGDVVAASRSLVYTSQNMGWSNFRPVLKGFPPCPPRPEEGGGLGLPLLNLEGLVVITIPLQQSRERGKQA